MTQMEVSSVEILRTTVAGELLTPEDSRYEQTRTIFMGGFDRRPAAIVRPADDADVARAVVFARESGTELAIRSGGHSSAGHSTTDGGLVIDMRSMSRLELDVSTKTAWAETGLSAGAYTEATGDHGLATGFGDTGSVGIGGITSAGGIGFLVRRHGLTIDNVLAADVVTADGEILRVDHERHPDLFWAIRGGGGNMGVITRIRFQLHDVGKVTGGMMILPASPEVLAGAIAEAEAAPEDLSAIIMTMKAPPLPFLPPEIHGREVVLILMTHIGRPGEGEAAAARFRGLARPLVDQVGLIRYPEMFGPEEPEFHPVGTSFATFIDEFDLSAATEVMDHLARSDADMAAVQFRVLGGAVARMDPDATAFAHRQRKMLVNVAAIHGSADPEPHRLWVSDVVSTLRRGIDTGAYVGFLSNGDEAATRSAYPGRTWERLAAIKARYDPTNLFRLNYNVPPSG